MVVNSVLLCFVSHSYCLGYVELIQHIQVVGCHDPFAFELRDDDAICRMVGGVGLPCEMIGSLLVIFRYA